MAILLGFAVGSLLGLVLNRGDFLHALRAAWNREPATGILASRRLSHLAVVPGRDRKRRRHDRCARVCGRRHADGALAALRRGPLAHFNRADAGVPAGGSPAPRHLDTAITRWSSG